MVNESESTLEPS